MGALIAGAGVAAAGSVTVTDPDRLVLYEYKGLGGGSEHYAMLHYDVANPGSSAEYNSVKWSLVTDAGRQIDDSLHPIVLGLYCGQHAGCPDHPEQFTNKDVMPGATLHGVAVLGPIGTPPPSSMKLVVRVHVNQIWYTKQCVLDSGGAVYTCSQPPKAGRKKK